MKVKFNSNDELPLNETLKIPIMTLLELFFMKKTNTIYRFFEMNVCVKHKNGV